MDNKKSLLRSAYLHMIEDHPYMSISFLRMLESETKESYEPEIQFVIHDYLLRKIKFDDFNQTIRSFICETETEDVFDIEKCLNAIENDFSYERTFGEILRYLWDIKSNLKSKIRTVF